MQSRTRTVAWGLWAGLALMGLLAAPLPGRAMTWAMLIGVEKYQHPDIGRAENAAADPELLAKTLDQRGNVDADKRIRVLNDRSKANLRPTRGNITRLLSAFSQQGTKNDRLIIFFSGHGFRDKEGKTFLAPIDCDPNRLSETAIELARVREALRRSPAGSKFLILDACHAGNPRGDAATPITFGELKSALKDETGIYTLASCTTDQQSYPNTNPKNPFGLFTFWLNLGLQGAADKDGDGKITADELFNYVRPIVAKMTADKQTPDRIVQAQAGDPEILRLLPEKIVPSVERLGKQVHAFCQLHNVHTLAVTEFSISTQPGAEKLQGALGLNLAKKIQEKLSNWPGANYKVLDIKTATSVLGRKANPENLSDFDNLTRLKEKLKAEAHLTGTLELVRKVRSAYKLIAKLTGTDGTALGSFTALIDDPDGFVVASSGSALVPREEVIPRKSQIRNPEVRDWLRYQLKQAHPLFDPDCPYRLEIRDASGRYAKELYYMGNDKTKLYVKVRRGENVTLYVANRTGTRGGGSSYSYGYSSGSQAQGLNRRQDYNGNVFVRLWVDGLNVLGKTPDLPEEAWPWIFPAQSEKVIRGWHLYKHSDDDSQEFDVRPFKIVDAPSSVAGRQGYSQEIGQVTAFFYAATEMNWLRKLGFGEEENVRLRVLYPSHRKGEKLCMAYPLAWITIHYISEEEDYNRAEDGLDAGSDSSPFLGR